MGILKRLRTFFADNNVPTPRYDTNGIHRSWSYDKTNESEVESLTSFAEYTTHHGVPQRYVNVWTDNRRIYHNIRAFMFDPVHNRYTHYLVYPTEFRSNNGDATYWSISFADANNLDPKYHKRCVFATSTCSYCQGPNKNTIG